MRTPDSLPDIQARLRLAWATRRVCGLVGMACAIRVERIVALEAAGRLALADALRLAAEAEAITLCAAPLDRP